MSPFAVETIARVAHEVNRAYCAALGDHTQLSWWEAPDWQRKNVRQGVRGILDGTYATAEQQHDAWLERKAAEGWTYGPMKDVEAKLHPAMVPWSSLPIEHRAKSAICRAVCHEVAISIGANAEEP